MNETSILINDLYNTCIYTKLYCGYFWGACIVAAEMLVEELAVPVVAVAVVDSAAATLCEGGGTRATVGSLGAAAERAWIKPPQRLFALHRAMPTLGS